MASLALCFLVFWLRGLWYRRRAAFLQDQWQYCGWRSPDRVLQVWPCCRYIERVVVVLSSTFLCSGTNGVYAMRRCYATIGEGGHIWDPQLGKGLGLQWASVLDRGRSASRCIAACQKTISQTTTLSVAVHLPTSRCSITCSLHAYTTTQLETHTHFAAMDQIKKVSVPIYPALSFCGAPYRLL
jgi:hypothetical protein